MEEKIYTIIRIDEDDYGCEARPDDYIPMVKVLIRDEEGNEEVVMMDDSLMYSRYLDEGSETVIGYDGTLFPPGMLCNMVNDEEIAEAEPNDQQSFMAGYLEALEELDNQENVCDIRIAKIISEGTDSVNIEPYGMASAEEVVNFHKTIDEYKPTRLCRLEGLAKMLGVGSIYVKDESQRFGLNAFKGLGGSYAIHKLTEGTTGKKTFITATDGNHGRGVAWAATRLGHEAYVYMPRGTAAERLDNIRKLGAHAEILDMVYDDVVRYAADMAYRNDWILVQDTSWSGYEDVPTYIMQGYITMGYEIVNELENHFNGQIPTHVFLQAGVGSMAGAMTAFLADYYGENKPKIIIVEPDGANCIYKTAAAADGKLHYCGEEMSTIMAGLCCGEPCPIAWDIMRDYADYALTCPDRITADGMRILGNPLSGDDRIISGESGAVSVGVITELMSNDSTKQVRNELGLDENSVVLCISTEGATDTSHYRDVVWFGRM